METTEAQFTVLGIDVISYSLKPLKEQVQAQETLDRCLRQACDKLWPEDASKLHWIDAGDGGFLLACGDELSVVGIVADFHTRMQDATQMWKKEDRIELRYALHTDRIKVWKASWGNKYTGHAINNCARLLSGMNKKQKGQVVCSGEFYDCISTFGNESVVATRLNNFVDKHNFSHKVYNLERTPGFGVSPLSRELHVDPLAN